MLAGEIIVNNDAYELDLATGRITQLTRDINTVAIAANSDRTIIAAQYVPLGEVIFREWIDGGLKPLQGAGDVAGQSPEISADGRILYTIIEDPERVNMIEGPRTEEWHRMPEGNPSISLGATAWGTGDRWLTVDQFIDPNPPPRKSNLMLFEGKRLVERQQIPSDLHPVNIAWDGGDIAMLGRPKTHSSNSWARAWSLRKRGWVSETLEDWQIVSPSPDFKHIMVSQGSKLGIIEPGKTSVTEVATLPWTIWEGDWVN